MEVRPRRIAVASAAILIITVLAICVAGAFYMVSSSPTVTVTSTSTAVITTTSTTSTISTTTTSYTPTTSTTSTTASATASSNASSIVTFPGSITSTTCSVASTSDGTNPLDFGPLFGNFSAMSLSYQVSMNDTFVNEVASYQVVNESSGAYTVNATILAKSTAGESGSNSSLYITFVVLSNGTIATLTEGGQTLTGLEAELGAFEYLGPFVTEDTFQAGPTAMEGFGNLTTTNSSVIELGGENLNVTNYAPVSLPIVSTDCLGVTTTVTGLSLQVGSFPGETYALATSMNIQMTLASPSPTYESIALHVLSVTPVPT